jgi:hypothetical protein
MIAVRMIMINNETVVVVFPSVLTGVLVGGVGAVTSYSTQHETTASKKERRANTTCDRMIILPSRVVNQ